MTTPSELGFATPIGTDLLTHGDDAITQNAHASAEMYDSLKETRRVPTLLGTGVNPDALTEPNWYRYALTPSNTSGRPQGFSRPYELTVTRVGQNATRTEVCQIAHLPQETNVQARIAARYGKIYADRTEWTEWTMLHGAMYLVVGDDLNDFMYPTELEASTYNISSNISNRPDGMNDQFTVKVSRAGTTVFQEARCWTRDGLRIANRRTAGGVYGPWEFVAMQQDRDETNGTVITDRTRVTLFGDSQVDGTPISDAIQSALSTTTTNYGRSGDTVDQVAIRAGVKELWYTITGGQIPSTGTANLDTTQPFDSARDRSFSGTLSGITGTLNFISSSRSWTFTRGSSGNAVTATGLQRFIPSQAGTSADTLIVWMGGNNTWETGEFFKSNLIEHVKAQHQAFIDWAAPQKHVLLPGVTFGASSEPGEARHDLAIKLNEWLSNQYPTQFCDLNQWLIENGMAAAGLTDTQEDIDARASGLMPPTLLDDDVHFKPEVRTEIGTYLAAQLRQRGWA